MKNIILWEEISMLELGINLVINVFLKNEAKKTELKKYGQIIYTNMSSYGEKLEALIDQDQLNDFSLLFDEKLEILDEGLELMINVLKEVHSSDAIRTLKKEERQHIIDLEALIREKKENISNDEYYDEEYEVNKDILIIHEFYQEGKKRFLI